MANQRLNQQSTILSGIQPSGNLHIGNYLGAVKQWVDLQAYYHVFIMIADLHAITVPQEPKELRVRTLALANLLLACGIDPEHSTLFLQSHVPAHAELGWIFNTMTPLGELERMTQFKEKSDAKGAYAGLLNYPTLQAADILLYQPNAVPVGDDQLQHLELTRELARRFNNRFGETFVVPKPLIMQSAGRIMGLDDPTKKMSKSAESQSSYIAILDTPDEIRKKIKNAVTDSGKEIEYNPSAKPAIANLIAIMSAFSGSSEQEVAEKHNGKGYAEFKSDLAELIVKKLAPIQETYRKLAENPDATLKILKQGAKNARETANETLNSAKEKMGFVL
ncbi:MAG: tryptophan--tRNA ligase [Candidatus Sungbacteria bacterium]|nr:tryptophan--tRNA ligase [Candidatus Sungbacteria bacterium]